MTTERQKRANQENGRKSKGPVTPAGKRRSSRNAIKHGLTARDHVILGESTEAFLAFRDAQRETWSPDGAAKEFCIDGLVSTGWRLSRTARIETAVFINEARRRRDSLVPASRKRWVSRTSQLLGGAQAGVDEDEEEVSAPSEQEIEEAPLRELAEIYTGGVADQLRKLDRHATTLYRQYQSYLQDLMALQKRRLG